MTHTDIAVPVELADRCLFIVGHARSGTTVLQYALNTSSDIHVFGEANFHNHPGGDAFADWYNEMHTEVFQNLPAKGDRCPQIAGTFVDALEHLSQRYRWVGDKMAFRDDSLGYDFERSLKFQSRWFANARYICTLRSPLPTLTSNSEMFRPEDLRLYTLSYAKSLLHLVNTYLVFDHTLIAHYEQLSQAAFDRIGAWLDVSLSEAMSEYDIRRLTLREGPALLRISTEAALVSDAYEKLAALINPDTLRIPDRGALRGLQENLAALVQGLSDRMEPLRERL